VKKNEQENRKNAEDQYWISLTTLSEAPRIFYIDNFLTEEECDLIISLAKEKLVRSKVGGTYEASAESDVRTSRQAWIDVDSLKLPKLSAIRSRVEALTRVPSFLAEFMQVVSYDVGQFYLFHTDVSRREAHTDNPYYQGGGNRLVTVLFYMNHVEPGCGGETVFPAAFQPTSYPDPCCDASACPNALRVSPKKGAAIMWYNLEEEDQYEGKNLDVRTIHAGCPVKCGHKFAANYWVRNKRVDGKLYSHIW